MRLLIVAVEIVAIITITLLIMRTSRIRPGRTPSGRPSRYTGRHRYAPVPVRVRLELRILSIMARVLPAPTYTRKAV